jgi:hypothetical protein
MATNGGSGLRVVGEKNGDKIGSLVTGVVNGAEVTGVLIGGCVGWTELGRVLVNDGACVVVTGVCIGCCIG